MIDPSVRKLLRDPLDTYEKLEVAVALVRAPGHALSLAELQRSDVLSAEQIARGVEDLARVGLVHTAGGLVRLAIPPAETTAYLALSEQHARDAPAIAVALSELALEKIRGMTAHAFAEAFHSRTKKR